MNTRSIRVHQLIQRSLGLLACTLSISAFACPSDALTGTICPTAANYCPVDGNGYTIADGRPLDIRQYPALFSLIGYIYGGSQNTFYLPDLRGRTPVGVGQGAGLSPVALGEKRGAETTPMTMSNMAFHNHTATFQPTGLSVTVPVSTTPSAPVPVTTPDTTHNYLSAAPTTGPTGAGIWTNSTTQIATVGKVTTSVSGVAGNIALGTAGTQTPTPVPTLPPQLGLTYCIATYGSYPPNPN
ncbi:phage tail protein [Dechloromonas sp. ZY10]|uniref:phage tail protein n=1 Tax=Dechloromonas aquae TaxID=2664436 RepID=UPI003528F677